MNNSQMNKKFIKIIFKKLHSNKIDFKYKKKII